MSDPQTQCPRFKTCSAPLCPLDSTGLETGVWYPGEDICKAQKENQVDWIKRQRKIAAKSADVERYFTYKMLCRNCVIGKGIKGIGDAGQEAAWFEKHPIKKEMSEEDKQRLAETLKKARFSKLAKVT